VSAPVFGTDLNGFVARMRNVVESYRRAHAGVPRLSFEELDLLLDAAAALDQAMRLGDAGVAVVIRRTGDPALPWTLSVSGPTPW
jgi:hypothetical protein